MTLKVIKNKLAFIKHWFSIYENFKEDTFIYKDCVCFHKRGNPSTNTGHVPEPIEMSPLFETFHRL